MKSQDMIAAICGAIILAFAGGFAGGTEYSNIKHDALADIVSQAEGGLRTTLVERASTARREAEEFSQRAYACEQKFSMGTVMFEPRALGSASFLHGTVSLDVGNGMQMSPAWFVPAQVQPHSAIPGAQYRWIDNQTGEIKGTFAAVVDAPGQAQNQ